MPSMLDRPLTAQLEERMRRSREKTRKFSVVCVLITNIARKLAKFLAMLEKSPSDLRVFLRVVGWLFGTVARQFSRFLLTSRVLSSM